VKKNPTVIPVVALALIDEAGRVLLQRRSLAASMAGYGNSLAARLKRGKP
jgi:hypothetical protein